MTPTLLAELADLEYEVNTCQANHPLKKTCRRCLKPWARLTTLSRRQQREQAIQQTKTCVCCGYGKLPEDQTHRIQSQVSRCFQCRMHCTASGLLPGECRLPRRLETV